MNAKQIIPAFTKEISIVSSPNQLNISEFYFDTIQGEGIYTGHPAAFLRLQGCSLGCVFCDTTEVWRTGNPYTIDELLQMMEDSGLVKKLEQGQHLVITGGSPMLQMDSILVLLNQFYDKFGFDPFVEMENECSIMPKPEFISCVDLFQTCPLIRFNT
jgi:organic radical activating enzyme